MIAQVAVLMVVTAAVVGVFSFLQGYLSEQVSQGIAFDLRNALYEKIQRLSFSYHDRASTGQLMTRLPATWNACGCSWARGFTAVNAVLLLVGIALVMVALNWRMALVMVPILPIAFVVFFSFMRVARPLFMTVQAKLGAFNAVLQENVAGFRVVKAFVRADFEQKRFRAANMELLQASLKGQSHHVLPLLPATFMIAGLGQVAIVALGGSYVIQGTLALGGAWWPSPAT